MSNATETTYSTIQACEMAGISYRILDYWLRTGRVGVEHPTPGTGFPRRWSQEEVRRLKAVVAAYDEAQEVLAALRSGELWARSE